MKPLRVGLLPVIMLVVVIAWALFAVAMLTGTLVAAQKIGNRVGVINEVYPQVNENLNSIALAGETGRIADEITRTVAPIGPQFTQVVDAVGSINGSAKSIEGNVASINGSVKTINTSVKTIGGTVTSIDSTLSAVNDRAQSINGSVKSIAGSFDGILNEVRSIDDRVKGINNRADAVIGVASGIKDDLDRVLEIVPGIIQNSQAIEDSPVLLFTLQELLDVLGLMELPLPIALPLDAAPVAVEPPAELLVAGPGAVVEAPPLVGNEQGVVPEAIPTPAPDDAVPLGPLGSLFGN